MTIKRLTLRYKRIAFRCEYGHLHKTRPMAKRCELRWKKKLEGALKALKLFKQKNDNFTTEIDFYYLHNTLQTLFYNEGWYIPIRAIEIGLVRKKYVKEGHREYYSPIAERLVADPEVKIRMIPYLTLKGHWFMHLMKNK